jgi:vesicle-associated membrane protein 7
LYFPQEFSNNNASDELSKVQSQIDGVKEVMVQNIDKIIGRGEKIEMLVQKSEGLNDSALEVCLVLYC